MNKPALSINNLTVTYHHDPVLWNITLTIPSNTLVGIVGPNGAGKTTLIKAILGLIKPIAGIIKIFGKPIYTQNQAIAYIPQRSSIDWDFPATVLDIVLMGRYRHLGWFKRPGKKDKEKALQAIEQVGLSIYQDAHISQLSGGQQQRVFIARALVQEAMLYLLDEPFVGVDAVTEKTIIKVLKDLRNQGKTIMVVHHDLQTLTAYFDWLLLLNRTTIACGPTQDVLVQHNLQATYNNDVKKRGELNG